MSGLIRGMIDQVLKNMGEGERKESVNYVTDRMIEKSNAIRRRLHDFNSLANGLMILAGNATMAGDVASAHKHRVYD